MYIIYPCWPDCGVKIIYELNYLGGEASAVTHVWVRIRVRIGAKVGISIRIPA